MMDFSTPCSLKPLESARFQAQRRRLLLGGVGLLAAPRGSVPLVAPALAQAHSLRLDNGVLLQQEEGELFLSSDVPWQLPSAVEQALRKGVAVHFVAEVQLLRQRWYWSNQRLLTATRYYRLSYQALTHRWRLHTGSQPFNGLGLGTALGNSYTDLADALQTLQHWVRWRIGARDSLPADGPALLQLRFRIDLSQLPKPLQIGAFGRSDWNLLVQQTQPLMLEQL